MVLSGQEAETDIANAQDPILKTIWEEKIPLVDTNIDLALDRVGRKILNEYNSSTEWQR